jgi:hypothetical protein
MTDITYILNQDKINNLHLSSKIKVFKSRLGG